MVEATVPDNTTFLPMGDVAGLAAAAPPPAVDALGEGVPRLGLDGVGLDGVGRVGACAKACCDN
jgi:hypothetical protein